MPIITIYLDFWGDSISSHNITYCIRPSSNTFNTLLSGWATAAEIKTCSHIAYCYICQLVLSSCSFQVKTRRCGRSLCSACPCWCSCMEEMVMTVCRRHVCGALNTCCAHRCKPNPSESNAQHLGSSSDWWVVRAWCADTLTTDTWLKYFCVILEPWPLLFLYFPT